MAIRDYRDRRTAAFVAGERVPAFEQCARAAVKALTKLQNASRLVELRNPPSNHFEALSGDREECYSIRIDQKWRLCFRWAPRDPILEGADILMVPGQPFDVEMTDHYEGG